MKKEVFIVFLIAGAAIFLAAAPVSAAVQEISYRGTLASLDPSAGTITLSAGYTYGCDFTNGTALCSWDPVQQQNLTGTVPDKSVFSILKPGDPVVATSMGGPGGTWIGIAKVFPTPGIENWLATDIIGDPSSLPVGLASGYSFAYTTTPECGNCTGSVCNALSAAIVLNSTGRTVMEKTVINGEKVVYNGRNDNSSVEITFVHGQGLADQCPGKAGIVGLQPVSTFIIHVNQAVTAPAGTTLTAPVTTLALTSASTQVPLTSVPATKAAPSMILPISALGILGLFIACRARKS